MSRLEAKLKQLGLSTAGAGQVGAPPRVLHDGTRNGKYSCHVYFPRPPYDGLQFDAMRLGAYWNFVGHILGERGATLHHIMNTSGAYVEVQDAMGHLRGKRPDPADKEVNVYVCADSMEKVERAVQVVASLCKPINAELKPFTVRDGGKLVLKVQRPNLGPKAARASAKPAAVLPAPPPGASIKPAAYELAAARGTSAGTSRIAAPAALAQHAAKHQKHAQTQEAFVPRSTAWWAQALGDEGGKVAEKVEQAATSAGAYAGTGPAARPAQQQLRPAAAAGPARTAAQVLQPPSQPPKQPHTMAKKPAVAASSSSPRPPAAVLVFANLEGFGPPSSSSTSAPAAPQPSVESLPQHLQLKPSQVQQEQQQQPVHGGEEVWPDMHPEPSPPVSSPAGQAAQCRSDAGSDTSLQVLQQQSPTGVVDAATAAAWGRDAVAPVPLPVPVPVPVALKACQAEPTACGGGAEEGGDDLGDLLSLLGVGSA